MWEVASKGPAPSEVPTQGCYQNSLVLTERHPGATSVLGASSPPAGSFLGLLTPGEGDSPGETGVGDTCE